MRISFPKEEENLSPRDAFIAYEHFADYHLHFLKQQSSYEFFYWKGLGVFFVLSMGLFILRNYGFVISPFMGISFIGLGFLLVLARSMRMDFEYGVKAAACAEKGLLIEKKFDYPVKLFSIFEENKLISYRGYLLSRLFSTGLIGLATTIAGMLSAIELSALLAVIYVKTARKILLNGESGVFQQ